MQKRKTFPEDFELFLSRNFQCLVPLGGCGTSGPAWRRCSFCALEKKHEQILFSIPRSLVHATIIFGQPKPEISCFPRARLHAQDFVLASKFYAKSEEVHTCMLTAPLTT